MLKIHNGKKQFGSQIIFSDLTFEVAPKSIVGLLGPSGSGKSTLLRCIQGLESLDDGEIICNEKSGFMFQDFQLFPHMSVLNNLVYAPKVSSKTSDYHSKACQLLKHLGIADKEKHFPHQLSGGQRQRVALARSLMMHPRLLLCDEPTSGLDAASMEDVVTLLKSIREMGVTMLIASHDLKFLTKITDRTITLHNGKITNNINEGVYHG